MRQLLILIAMILFGKIIAQDIRGAYIQTHRISGLTYSISVTLFTESSLNITRPTIPINFGDGFIATFTLSSTSNISGVNVKTYSGTHTYSGSGIYYVTYLDSFRIAGIKNLSNSQTKQIFVESMLILNNLTNNSSPVVSVYPLNFSINGNQVIYNPGCSDNDADSISYALINCAPSNYYLPSNAVINNSTGTFGFSKDSIGIYAFCIKITEWKKNSSNIYNTIGYSQIDFVINITPNLGVKEIGNKQLNIFVYPNPIKDKLTLEFQNEISKIDICNSLGQIVYTLNTPNQKQEIDLSFLASGIYYLKIQSTSSQKTFKIIRE